MFKHTSHAPLCRKDCWLLLSLCIDIRLLDIRTPSPGVTRLNPDDMASGSWHVVVPTFRFRA
jgi:hypothetical protein